MAPRTHSACHASISTCIITSKTNRKKNLFNCFLSRKTITRRMSPFRLHLSCSMVPTCECVFFFPSYTRIQRRRWKLLFLFVQIQLRIVRWLQRKVTIDFSPPFRIFNHVRSRQLIRITHSDARASSRDKRKSHVCNVNEGIRQWSSGFSLIKKKYFDDSVIEFIQSIWRVWNRTAVYAGNNGMYVVDKHSHAFYIPKIVC